MRILPVHNRLFQCRAPFKPFMIKLVGGQRILVDHPQALIFRGENSNIVAANGTHSLFDHEGVSRLNGDSLPQCSNGLNNRAASLLEPVISAAAKPSSQ
ncbi:MAG: hypothetical protein IT427_04310 [Pirellulales bacterium]|nr:hypothetical protein [Pirellulales bacterium]